MNAPPKKATRRTWRRRILRWLLRIAIVIAAFVILYLLAVWILGAIAVNGDYRQPAEGIEIMVSTNGIHTDFYLPAKDDVKDWTAFAPLQSMASHHENTRYVLIGWGDRGFFLDVPTWDDVTVGVTLHAVFVPSPAVMHVYYRNWLPADDDEHARLRLREHEYRRLVAFLEDSFRRGADGRPILIPDRGYSSSDVFYEGVGSYHLFNTCNNWANRALDAAGVTTPLWSPFDGAIFAHLPR